MHKSIVKACIFLGLGKNLSFDLFEKIVDAIYYGGLYPKVKRDWQDEKNKNIKKQSEDAWPIDLMLSVFHTLIDSVSTSEINDISVQINRMAIIIGIIVAGLSLILSYLLP